MARKIGMGINLKLEKEKGGSFWSALTCQRFGPRRLDAALFNRLQRLVAATGRGRLKR